MTEPRRPPQPVRCSMAAPTPRVAFFVVVILHGLFVVITGPRYGGDTAAYSIAADALIASGFDYAAVQQQTETTYPPLLYALFASLLAALKLLMGEAWPYGLVALNLVASAGVAALLVHIVGLATTNVTATWAALLFFLVAFDLFQWTPYLLSDATFVFVSFSVFSLAAERIVSRSGRWTPVFVLAGAAAFYRPTGVVLFPATIWAYYLARSRPGKARKVVTALVGAGFVAGSFVLMWILQQPSRWPFSIMKRTIDDTARFYTDCEIVLARPEGFCLAPVSIIDYALLAGERFLHFFVMTAREFSVLHQVINLIFFIPIYLLAGCLAIFMVVGRDGLSQPQRDLFLAAWVFILATAAFHGLLQVDYDWRYRLPVLPHMMLMAAGGIAMLSRRMRLD